ncbi:hypothetical protein GRI89_02455 [Altererythrobacter salegens]|uniref:Glycerophosphoryl diester phosphodiesterase membrane domain-containing protein n=1 Tax=Croceibacterium salegens TaxID=1737568 RepID=A0A6I4SSU7_9SPHN|nr:hypothetical protein [Croceibacterium salegens]MXO58408.1 hypothetical protein [Croceibacterium salegens]
MEDKISVGEVVNGTFSVIGDNLRVVAIYVIGMTLGTSFLQWILRNAAPTLAQTTAIPKDLLDWFGIGAGLSGIVVAIAAVVAQYLLLQALLRQRGYLPETTRFRIFSYILMIVLLALANGIGLILFVVPGLFLMARWSAAVAFLIAEDGPVFEAMGSSWDAVRGNTTAIALAILAGMIIYYIVFAGFLVAGMRGILTMQGLGTDGLLFTLVTQFSSLVVGVFKMALGIWVYGRLHAPASHLQDTFS